MYQGSIDMAPNPLYVFLKQQGYWNYGKGKPSHLFFDNGKAFVPDDMIGMFNNYYANMIRGGHEQYIIEQKTPVFRFFMDLDITQEYDHEVLMGIIVQCFKPLVESYFQKPSDIILCSRPAKKTETTFKTGLHIIWESIYATKEDCIELRSMLVKECKTNHKGFLDWNKTIDVTVYKQCGLRMIGARKLDDTTTYMPSHIIHPDDTVEVVEDAMEHFKSWVQRTSLRYFGRKTRVGIPTSDSSADIGFEDEDVFLRSKNKDIEHIPLRCIQDSIPKIFNLLPNQYLLSQITGAFKIPNKTKTKDIYLLRCNSRYCMNKGGEHKTNNVYFQVNKDCVVQRCFCQCQTFQGRKYGMCKDFKSKAFKLTNELRHELFGIPIVDTRKSCLPAKHDPFADVLSSIRGSIGLSC